MKNLKNSKIYLFSNKITYKRFYEVWKKFPPTGITPQMMIKGKMVWEMIKNKQIYIFIDPEEVGDEVIFAIKLPKNKQIYILK